MPQPGLSPERRDILAEILVVGALGILPHLASMVYARADPDTGQRASMIAGEAYAMARCVAITAPLVWIMFRSGRNWRYFGIVPFKPRTDLTLAVLVASTILASGWVAAFLLNTAARAIPGLWRLTMLVSADHSSRSMHLKPTELAGWVMFAIYQLANGFCEELVLRAYLLTRIRELTGRPLVSILLVSSLAAAYHLYQGSYYAIVICFGQAVVCFLYLKMPRALAFSLGHALYDFMIMVLW